MMTFEMAHSKSRLTHDFGEKMLILFFLIKAQVTRKRINLHKSFFMNYGRASVGIFNFLKIRTSIDIFSTKKCKITFGLKYI